MESVIHSDNCMAQSRQRVVVIVEQIQGYNEGDDIAHNEEN
jgi:hypothetical protein